MKRRHFLSCGAGIAALLNTRFGQAEEKSQSISDTILSLNPVIQPMERKDKRRYKSNDSSDITWQTVVCQGKDEHQPRVGKVVQLEQLEMPNMIPELAGITVRQDYPATGTPGFYLYFSTLYHFIRLPAKKPENLISTTAKYMDCGGVTGAISGKVKKNSMSIDYRKFSLIQDDRVINPSHKVERRILPKDNNGFSDLEPYLDPLTGVSTWPNEDENYKYKQIQKTLFYDFPVRPIRFMLELPPITIQGIKIPLPTIFFEPFDILKDRFVEY